jgi:cytochrome b
MNTTSSPTQPSPTPFKLRVWDLPTRTFHWLLVLLVIGLIITGNLGGEWMMWHARFGYGVLTLLLFRLIWGVVGGHHSRFAHFLPSVTTLRAALTAAWRGPHRPSIGHNPIGALSVVAMLLVLALQAGSGLISDDEIAFNGPLSTQVSAAWVSLATWYHKSVGKRLLIALVVLHVLAMVYYRRRHGEALVRAMVVGDKNLSQEHAIHPVASRDGWRERLGALLVFGVCAGLVYALVQWGGSA